MRVSSRRAYPYRSFRAELFLVGGDPSPIRTSLLVGVHSYLSLVTYGFPGGGGKWTQYRVSTYKGQRQADAELADNPPPLVQMG